jgi:Tfp pilus assembly protein PilX
MQRKNYFLKTNPHKKRSGFAMIMAIAVIVIIATIMALSLALTTETSKRTVDLYLYEQTALHAKSATELALLEIAKRDPNTNCLNSYNTTLDDIYDVNITMRYIFTGTVGTCSKYFDIVTPEQNGSVLMDTTVSVNNTTVSSEPIRYFRRTIQKL